jgi:hypothetical protein
MSRHVTRAVTGVAAVILFVADARGGPSDPRSPASERPYFVEHFGKALPGVWRVEPEGAVPSLINLVGNGAGDTAARLIVTPTSSGPNESSELTSLFLNNGDPRIHTARGEETWYRTRLRFPAGGYFPRVAQRWPHVVVWERQHFPGGL